MRKRQQQIEEKANEVQFAIFFSWIWKGIFNEKFLIQRKNSEVENPLISVQFPFNLIWINNICKRISYLEFEADQKRIHRGVNFKYILRHIYTSCLRVHFQCFESTICSFKLPWSRTHLIYYISWPAKNCSQIPSMKYFCQSATFRGRPAQLCGRNFYRMNFNKT